MAGPFLGETEARRESLRTVFYEVCPQGREKLHVTPGKTRLSRRNHRISRHIKENTVMDNEKRKRYSLPLVTRKMKNKTVVQCHYTSTGKSEIKKIGNAMSPSM